MFNKLLEHTLAIELKGKKIKQMDESTSGLAYFSGGSPAIITTNMPYYHTGDIVLHKDKLMRIKKVKEIESFSAIPNLVLDEDSINKLIERNQRRHHGYCLAEAEFIC